MTPSKILLSSYFSILEIFLYSLSSFSQLNMNFNLCLFLVVNMFKTTYLFTSIALFPGPLNVTSWRNETPFSTILR